MTNGHNHSQHMWQTKKILLDIAGVDFALQLHIILCFQGRREAGVLRHHRGRDSHASDGPQDRIPDQLRGHVSGADFLNLILKVKTYFVF